MDHSWIPLIQLIIRPTIGWKFPFRDLLHLKEVVLWKPPKLPIVRLLTLPMVVSLLILLWGDDHSITAFVPPEVEDIFIYICTQFDLLMATTEKTLPSQWSLSDLSLQIIGEKGVKDLPYLIDVFSDLSLHGSQSWYWEEASQLLTLITSSGIL